jgi:predicted deacetylase
MPEGQYLIRFDDICPSMNWTVWEEIEAHLVRLGIRPILAVVPDNRDPGLEVAAPRGDFWDRVRAWQDRGWSIALHGYQHTYVNAEPGILKLNARSEFAGLSFEAQLEKLELGLGIFARHGVRAEAWVAPSHSFDWNTVKALDALGIRTISDGFALRPFRTQPGIVWVPQQFAGMRRMPLGIWTFCCHLNGLTREGVAAFCRDLERLAPRMISLPEAAAFGDRERSPADRLVGAARGVVSGLRRLLSHRD